MGSHLQLENQGETQTSHKTWLLMQKLPIWHFNGGVSLRQCALMEIKKSESDSKEAKLTIIVI